MAELNKNYKKIINELEGKIKNPQELEFIKSKITELTMTFIETLDKLVESSERQLMLENKLNILQNSLKRIEEDIYIEEDDECNDENCEFCSGHMHDNDYEFEILCPYCDYEFVTGKDVDLKKEIECPNCHNIIELDWEEHCDGECDECKNHCYHENESQEELKIKEEENNNYKHISGDLKQEDKKDENEDDM